MINIVMHYRIIARSRNLRGIIDYARDKSPVILLHIFKNADGTGYAHIVFDDGAYCDVSFASYTILKHWADRRMLVNPNFAMADYSYQ